MPCSQMPGCPSWAPRVPKHKIAQLYATDAKGIVDEELIDEVGYAIFARCKSILAATEAARGRAGCPKCKQIIKHSGGKEEILQCNSCQWQGSWKAYQKSYQHKQLSAGGMEQFFKEYVDQFPKTRRPREKMILIDTLIHRYHWEMTADISRPGAVNLISGRMRDVIDFLDKLSYGEKSTPTTKENKAAWRDKRDRAFSRWRKEP